MSHLTIAKIECVGSRDNFGRFTAEPLEKGFGVTLGNAMRRVLLGYLPGAAVTMVKIDGIQHEFSAIPYVKEEATEFILNVKTLRLKSLTGQPGKLTLDVEGERRVCAADIKPSADFEIANPELYLATLDSPEAKLYVEFDVELAEGYRPAESSDNLPVGTIPIDAVFTPIRKVNFNIEPIHAGRESSHERLRLDVWTDGTISPEDAISQSADILIEQLSPFAKFTQVSEVEAEEGLAQLPVPDKKYNTPVDQMDLSVRTMNCLRRAGIATVGEIISKGAKDLMNLRNFGQRSKLEIEDRLNGLGLSFYPKDKEGEEEEEEESESVAQSIITETDMEADITQPEE